MKKKKALIVGSSGLVGSELLQLLLKGNEYEKIYALVRSPIGVEHPKLVEVICDFDKLEFVQEAFAVDDVFSCLGTTIKKAKTKEAMYKVDVEYPLAIAKLALKSEVNHFLFISSVGANPKSMMWYLQMKGILEEKLIAVPFHKISIFRPSLLLGNRKEVRLGEKVSEKLFRGLSFLIKRSWRSRLAIEVKTVAQAMYKVAQEDNEGIAIYSSNAIAEL
jgi:uncharacterized protein YbjT (DUF2867 family)